MENVCLGRRSANLRRDIVGKVLLRQVPEVAETANAYRSPVLIREASCSKKVDRAGTREQGPRQGLPLEISLNCGTVPARPAGKRALFRQKTFIAPSLRVAHASVLFRTYSSTRWRHPLGLQPNLILRSRSSKPSASTRTDQGRATLWWRPAKRDLFRWSLTYNTGGPVPAARHCSTSRTAARTRGRRTNVRGWSPLRAVINDGWAGGSKVCSTAVMDWRVCIPWPGNVTGSRTCQAGGHPLQIRHRDYTNDLYNRRPTTPMPPAVAIPLTTPERAYPGRLHARTGAVVEAD